MNERIQVIHYSDVGDYLINLQKTKIVGPKDLVCACCGGAITAENFGGVARFDNKLIFSCNNESCLLNFTNTNVGT